MLCVCVHSCFCKICACVRVCVCVWRRIRGASASPRLGRLSHRRGCGLRCPSPHSARGSRRVSSPPPPLRCSAQRHGLNTALNALNSNNILGQHQYRAGQVHTRGCRLVLRITWIPRFLPRYQSWIINSEGDGCNITRYWNLFMCLIHKWLVVCVEQGISFNALTLCKQTLTRTVNGVCQTRRPDSWL